MVTSRLTGLRMLVVEDEYFLADDARSTLSAVGVEVIGPVPTASEASALIKGDQKIDCVLLDVNLRGEMAFDVADMLKERQIPYAFVTGYDKEIIPHRLSDAPCLGKPVNSEQLIRLSELLATPLS